MKIFNQTLIGLLAIIFLLTPVFSIGQDLPAVSNSPAGQYQNYKIMAPAGGMKTFVGTHTGAIKIKLPQAVKGRAANVIIKVEVYNFVGGSGINDRSFTATFSGKMGANWNGCSAQILTARAETNPTVYFGKDEDGNGDIINNAIWFVPGEKLMNSTVVITEVSAGRTSAADWVNGWDIEVGQSIPTNQTKVITNTFPLSSLANSIWKQDGNIASFPGSAHVKEVRVYVDAGADFVFAEDYELTDLEDLDAFVKEKKHLPEIASEAEMIKDGLELGEMNIRLLQKVEELTLYLIDLNKKVKALETSQAKQ